MVLNKILFPSIGTIFQASLECNDTEAYTTHLALSQNIAKNVSLLTQKIQEGVVLASSFKGQTFNPA